MVVTKVFQIKQTRNLQDSLNYIEDDEKTKQQVLSYDGTLQDKLFYITDENKTSFDEEWATWIQADGKTQLISSYGLLSSINAYDEMMLTKMNAKYRHGDRQGSKVDVLAHHIIQSFSPDDKLTPEQVHEIGRRTVLELTGGEHEFVIATHMDKNHLHNHIIFNTTNSVTLKKFRWQKGTKKSLENISDKHAELFGAKIITDKKRFGHREYVAYKKQHSYRGELRERLKFLKQNAISLNDFVEKAKLLDVSMDLSGKEIAYKLLNSNQERRIRDRTLSKKGDYSQEAIEKSVALNDETKVISKENIVTAYAEYISKKSEDFEYRFIIEPWQIEKETDRGIYLNVSFGIGNEGTIFIDNKKFDKLEDGNYELFIKRDDYFYFLNEQHAEKNKSMKGYTLAMQLSIENGQVLFKKNYRIQQLTTLVEEFNYLSVHHITDRKELDDLIDKFKSEVAEVESELNRLDQRVAKLNKLQSALLGIENDATRELSQQLLQELNLSDNITKENLDKLLQEVTLERDVLRYKFNEIVDESDYVKSIDEHAIYRKDDVVDWNLKK